MNTTISVNYEKRKNNILFDKCKTDFNLDEIQNYNPIYQNFFELSNKNFNSVNLNHSKYIYDIHQNTENQNLEFIIKENDLSYIQDVFIKQAPILDPFKYLLGKYNLENYSLPSIELTESNIVFDKINDMNNSAYVDGLFYYLSSQLSEKFNFRHGIEFYGSFLAIKNNFKINIEDDFEYLLKSDYFNSNKHLFLLDNNTTLPILTIDHLTEHNLTASTINDDLFEDIFTDNKEQDEISNSLEEFEIDNTKILQSSINSSSTCSSRTSFTTAETEDDTEDETEDDTGDESEDDSEDDSEDNSEDNSEDDSEEIKVNKKSNKTKDFELTSDQENEDNDLLSDGDDDNFNPIDLENEDGLSKKQKKMMKRLLLENKKLKNKITSKSSKSSKKNKKEDDSTEIDFSDSEKGNSNHQTQSPMMQQNMMQQPMMQQHMMQQPMMQQPMMNMMQQPMMNHSMGSFNSSPYVSFEGGITKLKNGTNKNFSSVLKSVNTDDLIPIIPEMQQLFTAENISKENPQEFSSDVNYGNEPKIMDRGLINNTNIPSFISGNSNQNPLPTNITNSALSSLNGMRGGNISQKKSHKHFFLTKN